MGVSNFHLPLLLEIHHLLSMIVVGAAFLIAPRRRRNTTRVSTNFFPLPSQGGSYQFRSGFYQISVSTSILIKFALFLAITSSKHLLCSLAGKKSISTIFTGIEQSLYFQVYLIIIILGVSSKEKFQSIPNQPVPSLQITQCFTVLQEFRITF